MRSLYNVIDPGHPVFINIAIMYRKKPIGGIQSITRLAEDLATITYGCGNFCLYNTVIRKLHDRGALLTLRIEKRGLGGSPSVSEIPCIITKFPCYANISGPWHTFEFVEVTYYKNKKENHETFDTVRSR